KNHSKNRPSAPAVYPNVRRGRCYACTPCRLRQFRRKKEPRRCRELRGQRFRRIRRAHQRITLITEEPMRPATAESTVRALIDHLDEQRLRALIVELALAVLRCLATSPGSPEVAATPSNGRRRRHWSRARRAAETPRRRRRRPKVDASGNGSEPTANGRFAVSPAALWEHAAKLEP